MENTNFSLESFQKVKDSMVRASKRDDYESDYFMRKTHGKYTLKEIEKIIDDGSVEDKRILSQTFFKSDNFYRRILIYYATLLKYVGILVPNNTKGKSLKDSDLKKYYLALELIENLNLKTKFSNIALKALKSGRYYGVIQEINFKGITILDLPMKFCRSRFVDLSGNEIVEFDVTYFDTIKNITEKNETLKVYPKEISGHYKRFKKGKETTPWYIVPSEIGMCFTFYEPAPMFLDIIPATLQYKETVLTELEKDKEDIRKIIVQKVPHTSDGVFLLETEEAAGIHEATAGMMKNNKNVNVLTTFMDVDSISSDTVSDSASTKIETMVNNIFSRAGVSNQLFSATGNISLETSIKNDTAFVMPFAEKLSTFVTNLINNLLGNDNLSFKYSILPITYYNESDYVDSYFKLASSGYSFLLPAIASGLSQRDFISLKKLENDHLEMKDLLIPLSTSYTESGDEGGAPTVDDEDKKDGTIANITSIEGGT